MDNEKKLFVNTIHGTYVISVIAAWNAEMIMYPLDLIKSRLQIQDKTKKNIQYRGMMATTVGVVREEGIFKLWQGVTPTLCRHAIYSGTRVVLFNTVKSKLVTAENGGMPLWLSAICGASIGGFAQFISSPTELVKIQCQLEGRRRLLGLETRTHSPLRVFKEIFAKGGVIGLWRGSIPNAFRSSLVNIGDLTAYDFTKRKILQNTDITENRFVHILSSLSAGFVAAVMATPADVIKTRVMGQATDSIGKGTVYKGPLDCLQNTIRREGFFALYKGFLPVWIRLGPWAIIFWMSYEELQRIAKDLEI